MLRFILIIIIGYVVIGGLYDSYKIPSKETKLYNNGICKKCGGQLLLFYHKGIEDDHPVFDRRRGPLEFTYKKETVFMCANCLDRIQLGYLTRLPFYYDGFIQDKISEEILYRVNDIEGKMGISDDYWVQEYDTAKIKHPKKQ